MREEIVGVGVKAMSEEVNRVTKVFLVSLDMMSIYPEDLQSMIDPFSASNTAYGKDPILEIILSAMLELVSMSFYPDFMFILSRFYPNFIQI